MANYLVKKWMSLVSSTIHAYISFSIQAEHSGLVVELLNPDQQVKCCNFPGILFSIIDTFTGPSCSKLTTSLLNDSLKFQMAILQIQCYFLLKKIFVETVRISCIAV